MPITLNGSGTVTGISVGGLPDGIVDTDMIAAAAVTAPKRGPGSVLQVVQFTTATQVSVTLPTSSATTFYDTGLSGSITPSSTSSKVFVTAIVSFGVKASANGNKDMTLSITDSSNNILDNTAGGGQSYKFNETYQTHLKAPLQLLHSPNTTSSFTYKVRVNPYYSNNSSAEAVFQESSYDQNRSRLILMEIAG